MMKGEGKVHINYSQESCNRGMGRPGRGLIPGYYKIVPEE
jgi:hypothetical protein